MVSMNFPIFKGLCYRQIPENDCSVPPKHATYAITQFVMAAKNILHLKNCFLQYHITPCLQNIAAPVVVQKMEPLLFEKEWCHIILDTIILSNIAEYECWEASVQFLLLEVVYQVYAEDVAVMIQKTIINGTMSRILENSSLQMQPTICLLHDTKELTDCSNAVHQGCRGESCWEASVHCYFCWK